MNFRENQINKKLDKLFSRRSRIVSKARFWWKMALLIAVLAVAFTGTFSVVGLVKGLVDSTPDIEDIDIMPEGYKTTMYNSDGEKIQTLVGSDANRIYVTIDDIPEQVQPQVLIDAIIATEDSRFYEHKGIDLQGIIRAVYSGIVSSDGLEQGASTITQQLLKNQVFGGGNEKTFWGRVSRKFQEQCLAVKLENQMDKDQILEYYLNTINLGQNTLGVEAASERYFDKSVSDLTISEAAVLAGITQNPTEYNPISNQENNKQKRKTVLKYMLDQGYINESEYEDALGDDVYTRIQNVDKAKTSAKSSVNSYYVDAVIDELVKDLKLELGYTETQAYNAIYRRGLKIFTCQDAQIQKICDSVINDDSYYPENTTQYLAYELVVKNSKGDTKRYTETDIKKFYSERKGNNFSLYISDKAKTKKWIKKFKKNILSDTVTKISESITFIKEPQVSFVLMDQSTGKVKALVGGRGKKTANRTLNRATSSVRQPGSTFKILSTYLPALDTCGMTLATVYDDEPYEYPGTSISVTNWDSLYYGGATTIREAIERSVNVVAVKTMEDVTPQTGYDYLLNMGFTTLVDYRVDESGQTYTDIQLPTALGGLTDGVTNLELTAAYAGIANGGTYTEPVLYTKVVDHEGNVLLEKKPEQKRVMKKTTAALLTSAMEDVVRNGTGTAAALKDTDMGVAGKTGTTSDNTDYWFEGFTPYYSAGIWMGYDRNDTQEEGNWHKVIWKTIMDRVLQKKNCTAKRFELPMDDLVSKTICRESGLLAVDGVCPAQECDRVFCQGD